MRRDVYSGYSKLLGEEHLSTLQAANNYAASLILHKRLEEAKALFRKILPVARRVLGEGDDLGLALWSNYGRALYQDTDATLDDLREAVSTLEESTRIARRVLGGTHPEAVQIENDLRAARAALRARETPPSGT